MKWKDNKNRAIFQVKLPLIHTGDGIKAHCKSFIQGGIGLF